jgi:penicillin-binding protein 2
VDRHALDDEPMLRLAEARVGKAGVEAGMEAELRGIGGQIEIEVDARSRFVRRVSETAPIAGRDVRVTVESALQGRALERLAKEGRPGACVVLDCVTGEVRVMASTPSFDASQLAGASSKAAWQALAANADRPLLNRSIAGQYPPGSTFKMITALAGLEAGVLTTKEKIACWGDVTYGGHLFRCWKRRGHLSSDLHKALRESCDCYFYEVARRTGIEAIAATAHRFGLGQTFMAGIGQQKAGLIPTPGWKRNQTKSRTGWLLGETIMAGIGQGYVLATPLQLAVMTARIATGRVVMPTLVARGDGDPALVFSPLGVDEAALEAVRKGMVAVVNEDGGTGQAAGPDDGKLVVAGKTGTSQVSRASANRERTKALDVRERDHALMVAFWPAGKPRYAAAVVLEHAGGGGAMAGPVMHDLIGLMADEDALIAKGRTRDTGDDADQRAEAR